MHKFLIALSIQQFSSLSVLVSSLLQDPVNDEMEITDLPSE
jgi:hypothetical protein